MFNKSMMFAAVLMAANEQASTGSAGMDYVGVGVQDAKAMFQGQVQSDGIKREKALEMAGKLNGDQTNAWLDGLKKGCLEIGFTDGSAKNARAEFAAIFKAYPLTVNMKTEEIVDGKPVEKTVSIVAKDTLATVPNWNAMRDMARQIVRAAKEQGLSAGARGASTGTKAMKDTTFSNIYEDVAKRGTGPQFLQTLDLAITGLSGNYSQVIGEEIVKLREIESIVIRKVTEHHDKLKAAEKGKTASKALLSVVAQTQAKTEPAHVDEAEVVDA